ncbi:MAG: hydrogenase iron-sulfur subunit [Desulfatibacillum sp.]|nr:hydrogenase iron-sulfur subunit [Desulfatibacillum sp.]
MAEPKIGVWICNCKGRISGSLDTAHLTQEAAKLPNVVFVKETDILCSQGEMENLRQEIGESGADRVLFAGCSPRTSLRFPEEFITATLQKTGVNRAMYEVANIREQCAWLHEPGPETTAKALDEIAMAHARLRLDRESLPDVLISDKALVIGGGPAGLAAAKDLAGVGKEVDIVEKGTYLGGRLCQISLLFQSENWAGKCVSMCVGPVQASGVVMNPLIGVHTQSRISHIEKEDGNFLATIQCAPKYVDEDKCTACGECARVCPEYALSSYDEGLFSRKAIDKDFVRAVPDVYNIMDSFCTKCGECEKICPTQAIDLSAKLSIIQDTYGAVFLGTGFDAATVHNRPELGYASPDVVTGMEFERLLEHGVKRPSDGETPEHIVFVLCAGSRATRDKEGQGVPHCSKTCCGITMKQAMRVAQGMMETEVTIIYYYDIRTYERTFESLYDTVQKMGIEFVKGNIDAITASEEGGLAVSLNQLDDQTESSGGEHVFEDGKLLLNADMIVLASAQLPQKDPDNLITQLQLRTDEAGFPIENQPRIFRPTESLVDRVYVIGAASGPKVVQQAVEQGHAAAMNVLPYFLKGKKEMGKFASRIDPDYCVSCRICETVCPHGAIKFTTEGMVCDPAFCQACGFCAAACPTHAASLVNFSDQQILDQVDVAFKGVKNGDPKILALLCYWCSYAAADMASINGLKALTNFRSIRIRCSSSVNTALIMEMFKQGVDGILVGGCPPQGCHHINGNYLTDKRTALMHNLMEQLGLSTTRLRFDYIGVSNYQLFVDTIADMDKKLRDLGPNPAGRDLNR